MKDDDTLREGKPLDTNALNRTNKEAPRPVPGASTAAPKKRSSGRGLYITAIVLGIIIILLLILYIYLALTHKSSGHASVVPLSSIVRISNVWTFTGKSAILYPNIKYRVSA